MWGEALKTAAYILNRVPFKAVFKTPFELCTGRKPSLNHLYVWGCAVEARLYNPHERKLDHRTVSCSFVGYPKRSKGYRFYCSSNYTKLIETLNARFIEIDSHNGGMEPRQVVIDEDRSLDSFSQNNIHFLIITIQESDESH